VIAEPNCSALLGGLGETPAWPGQTARQPSCIWSGGRTSRSTGVMTGGRCIVIEGMGKAHSINGRLAHASDSIRSLHAQGFQDVGTRSMIVAIVGAISRARADAPWPGARCRHMFLPPRSLAFHSSARAWLPALVHPPRSISWLKNSIPPKLIDGS